MQILSWIIDQGKLLQRFYFKTIEISKIYLLRGRKVSTGKVKRQHQVPSLELVLAWKSDIPLGCCWLTIQISSEWWAERASWSPPIPSVIQSQPTEEERCVWKLPLLSVGSHFQMRAVIWVTSCTHYVSKLSSYLTGSANEGFCWPWQQMQIMFCQGIAFGCLLL